MCGIEKQLIGKRILEHKEKVMPKKDGKGPKGNGLRDGHGGGKGKGTGKGAGSKKGGKKGSC